MGPLAYRPPVVFPTEEADLEVPQQERDVDDEDDSEDQEPVRRQEE